MFPQSYITALSGMGCAERMNLFVGDELDGCRCDTNDKSEPREPVSRSVRFKQHQAWKHGGKDHKGRNHVQAEEVNHVEDELTAHTVFGISPVLEGYALESNHPVAGKAPAPVPRCYQQQNDRHRPNLRVAGEQQKCYRREYTPVWVIDRYVLKYKSAAPDDNRGKDIGSEECDNGIID